MAFELNLHDDVGRQVRKAAARQMEKAVKSLRSRPRSRRWQDKAAHSFRKRIKKIRALLRLVRHGLGKKTFARDNKALRNVARPLSTLRDATALIETLKSLEERYRETAAKGAFRKALSALRLRRSRILLRIEQEEALQNAALRMNEIHAHVDHWKLRHGRIEKLRSGLRKTYKQGRNAMEAARKTPSDELLHECRKRAKDLQYQLKLLQPLCPVLMKAIGEKAHRLTNLLGNDHDLAVLHRYVDDRIRHFIDRYRRELQASARDLGKSLFEESPVQFCNRIETAFGTLPVRPED